MGNERKKGTRYMITVFQVDSKGKEKITQCEIFDNRFDVEDFIKKHKAEPKEYRRTNKNPSYTMEGLL